MIPCEVLESGAYRVLPDYAVRVLVALASEYRGTNNGNLSLTAKRARALGVPAAWQVTAGLDLLRQVGLVRRTREGKFKHGRGVAALYALEWLPTDPTPQAYPPIIARSNAPNSWARWIKPADWTGLKRAIRRRCKGTRAPGSERTTIPHARVVPNPSEGNEVRVLHAPREDSSRADVRPTRDGDPLDLGPGTANTQDLHDDPN